MLKNILGLIERPEQDFIYRVLRSFDLGLCVDVGAAAGFMTRKMKLAGDENTRVVAFEPFPGNHDHFARTTAGLSSVEFVKKAVSDKAGTATLVVRSTVQGTEAGWEELRGYSSVGYLASPAFASSPGPLWELIKRKALAFARSKSFLLSPSLSVETTTLDREFKGKHIDFLKIDVQGGELGVLLGASTLLGNNGVSLLYVEWTGERSILDLLERHGYTIYDSGYIGSPKRGNPDVFCNEGFRIVGEENLSTGKLAYRMTLPAGDPMEVLDRVRRKGLGWVQTDLIACDKRILDRFLDAVRTLDAERAGPAVTSAATGSAAEGFHYLRGASDRSS